MTPTRALIESTITGNIVNAKACGHKAQAKLLAARNMLANIKVKDGDKKTKIHFVHAYGQAGEVSAFPVDTDETENLDADTNGLKVKCNTAFSRVTEMKVAWDGITPDAKDRVVYTDAMRVLDEALENIQCAREYADTAIEGTKQAVKYSFTEIQAEA